MPQVEWPGLGLIDIANPADMDRAREAAKRFVISQPWTPPLKTSAPEMHAPMSGDMQSSLPSNGATIGPQSLPQRVQGLIQNSAVGKLLGAVGNIKEHINNGVGGVLETKLPYLGGLTVGDINDLANAMTVFHGSPHSFDNFDASKIGTGEGAQAYGHGLYFAEDPAVANTYRQSELSYKRLNGHLTNKQEFVADHLSQGRPEMAILSLYANKYGGSFDDAMKDMISVKGLADSGNLYSTTLPDEHIASMLDWDKPLSQQSPSVQKSLAPALDRMRAAGMKVSPQDTGGNVYEWLRNAINRQGQASDNTEPTGGIPGAAAASKLLQDAGIPGIKYLDQGSRSAGAGTRNFVVFDPSILRDVARNGVSIPNTQAPANGPKIEAGQEAASLYGAPMTIGQKTPAMLLEEMERNSPLVGSSGTAAGAADPELFGKILERTRKAGVPDEFAAYIAPDQYDLSRIEDPKEAASAARSIAKDVIELHRDAVNDGKAYAHDASDLGELKAMLDENHPKPETDASSAVAQHAALKRWNARNRDVTRK